MDLSLLYKEKKLLNHQFPTVKAVNDPPTKFEGLIRCDNGEVKQLGDRGIWPFTEYVRWNQFRLDLPKEYPLKPPVATWLTEISHPNIVPNIPNAVCVSVLGEGWDPRLGLISVVNSLHYLLSDPNPENVFDHPASLSAARICRSHGFPKVADKKSTANPGDILHFNVVPIPRFTASPRRQADLVRFNLSRRAG